LHDQVTTPGKIIATTIVAVARVSAGHQDCIGSPFKGPEYKLGIDPARTGNTDETNMRRILEAIQPGQVSTRIGAPVTAKGYYFRLPIGPVIFY